jgi:hypothetical protein
MHVIPWKVLREAVTIEPIEGTTDERVVMTRQIFRLLMEAALANIPFDEKYYLSTHADVARSVQQGKCPGGRQHYVASGYYEGRDIGRAGFDEAWYLERYPDVKKAVIGGQSFSGWEHYNGPGSKEWRAPSKAAEPDLLRWQNAIKRARALNAAAKEAASGGQGHVNGAGPRRPIVAASG